MYAPSASITFVVDEMGKVVPMHEILPFLIPISSPSDKTSLAVTCQLSVVSELAMSDSFSFTYNDTVLDNEIKIHGVRSDAKAVVRNLPTRLSTTLHPTNINILYLLSPDIAPANSRARAS